MDTYSVWRTWMLKRLLYTCEVELSQLSVRRIQRVSEDWLNASSDFSNMTARLSNEILSLLLYHNLIYYKL